jgi:hypothetical protein
MTIPALGCAAATCSPYRSGLAAAGESGGRADGDVGAAPARTIKERLSGTAADEQRVNNCRVPPELRGPKPRPDDCRHGAGAGPTR